jgi:hypothetical protein
MLDYLVDSKVRRKLLRLLLVEHAAGSVSELAERARVAFSGAYRELHVMRQVGLVCAVKVDSALLFVADDSSPLVMALRTLMTAEPSREYDDYVRNMLFTLGAPTFGEEVPVEDVEDALLQGVTLSRRDGTVSSILPVVFYKQRDKVSPDRLVECARAVGEKRVLGFYLELTTELSGDKRFAEWARRLRDGRHCAVEYLSRRSGSSALAREVTEQHTPNVARKWNLRVNTGLDGFQSMFEKHAHA